MPGFNGFFASLVALLSCAFLPVRGGCSPDHDVSFDFYLLAIQWAPEFGAPLERWTNHGLWPSRQGSSKRSHTYPCTCTREKFDVDAVAAFKSDMETNWPTLFPSNSNEHFWSHEWSKHGTCTGMNQTEYFSQALAIRAKYNPGRAIGPEGTVFPSSVKEFSTDDIARAFTSIYGVPPMLGCRNKHGKQLLSEMGLCLNMDLVLTPCDASVKRIHDEVNDCDSNKPVWVVPTNSKLLLSGDMDVQETV